MRSPETKSNPAPTRASAPVVARWCIPVWLMAALLALVTLALYWPAMGHDFVYDDNLYVTMNVHVPKGLTLESVKWAFSNPVAANWHPLTMLSHMLDCQLFGLKPWGHHLTSALLHVVNTILVFLLLRRLTGATWRSLLVAALFGLHPLHVESVALVAERKDVLSTFFFLLTLLFYARFARGKKSGSNGQVASEAAIEDASQRPSSIFHLPSSSSYYLALMFFALGLMSKPMLVTLPFVLLLLDYWPLKRVTCDEWRVTGSDLRQAPSIHQSINPPLRLLLEKLPFFALAAVASIVTFMVQQHGGAMEMVQNLSFGARSSNALISYCRYLGKMSWPVDLAVFYPHPGHWPAGQVALAGGLLLGITVLLIVLRGRYPFMLMGWLWYCGTLVPVIGLVQVGGQAMADRYTYIPSLGVLILAIWGAYELTQRWRYQVVALSVAGGVAIVLCLGLTRQQLGYWQDSETLYRHALAVTENNYLAHNNLGNALLKKGQIDEGISQFQEAIRLKPDFANAHYNLGVAFNRKGQNDEAISQYQEAIRLAPDYAVTHNNLGATLMEKGRVDEAISQYQEAIRLAPDYADAYNNLGTAFDRKGQIAAASNQIREAIRLKPDFAEAYYSLGIALGQMGQIDEAINQYQEAIRLKPDYAEAHNNLGNALGRKGQTDEAINQFREAIHLKPDYTYAHNNLAAALLNKGRIDEAISQYREAVRLAPASAALRNNLGTALGMKGQTDEAISQFQEAVRLKPDFAEARNNLAHALEMKNAPAGR